MHQNDDPPPSEREAPFRVRQGGMLPFAEMLGIYAFEGPELVLRYRAHTIGKGAKPARPNSFKIELAPDAGSLVRLRRAKH
jgi:hypothetical protein